MLCRIHSLAGPISLSNEALALQAAVDDATAALKALPTSFDSDYELLEALTPGNHRSAVVYRMSRKRIALQHRTLLTYALRTVTQALRAGGLDKVPPLLGTWTCLLVRTAHSVVPLLYLAAAASLVVVGARFSSVGALLGAWVACHAAVDSVSLSVCACLRVSTGPVEG